MRLMTHQEMFNIKWVLKRIIWLTREKKKKKTGRLKGKNVFGGLEDTNFHLHKTNFPS